MSCFFNFDLELVDRSMHQDDAAFERVCEYLLKKYDQIERQIQKKYPDYPPAFFEHVRDSFIIDKFLPVFRDPTDKKIDDFNAWCWTVLKNCIKDAWRHFTAKGWDIRIEQPGDATGYGEDGESTFWEAHGAEILQLANPPSLSPEMQVEIADFLTHIRVEMSKVGRTTQKAVWMWANSFTYKEIASKLGLTTGNVGCIVSRAISDLQKKLCKKD